MEDLEGYLGNRVREGIAGSFRVLKEFENGRRVIDFFVEKWFCEDNNNTTVNKGRYDDLEIKGIIDLVLVKKKKLFRQMFKMVRRFGCSISNHFVVLCKVRLVRTCLKKRKVANGHGRLMSKGLRKR